MALFSVKFSACDFLILISCFTYFDSKRIFPSIFQIFLPIFSKKENNLTFLQQFFTFLQHFSVPAILSEEIEQMCVIHNISIATADDITSFGDDVNIYPVLLSRAIIIWGCCI